MADVSAAALMAGDQKAAEALRRSLATHGAALVRIGHRDAARLARLHSLAKRFFEQRQGQAKAGASRDVRIPSVGPAAVRLGWRAPSAAKELLRCFRGHPLPLRSRADAPLARSARLCEARMHALLTQCACAAIGTTERRLRRVHRHNCAFDIFYYPATPAAAAPSPSQGREQPVSGERFSPPFAGEASPPIACAPHIDRGLMHAIFAPVDGLQLWDSHSGLWRSPRQLWPHFDLWQHVTILANAELEQISPAAAPPDSRRGRVGSIHDRIGARDRAESPSPAAMRPGKRRKHVGTIGAGGPGQRPTAIEQPATPDSPERDGSPGARASYRACVHRVVMGGGQPRLSVSYELRAAFGVDVRSELA
jgi:hypothetical protein